MKGNLIIISSPSGGGKGTLIREILASVTDIGYSVSLTTRTQRRGEVNGRDYHFVSREEFDTFKFAGKFLESAEVHGNCYGTSLEQTEKMTFEGKDVILEIDLQGAESVLEKMPDAVARRLGDVLECMDVGIGRVSLVVRHGDQLGVLARLVFHRQHADRAHADD